MIIDGRPNDLSEYRSRLLIPTLLKTMQRLHVLKSDEVRFMAVRLVTGTAALFLLWMFLRFVIQAPINIALLVMAWRRVVGLDDVLTTVAQSAIAEEESEAAEGEIDHDYESDTGAMTSLVVCSSGSSTVKGPLTMTCSIAYR
jgi:hypothetical protein